MKTCLTKTTLVPPEIHALIHAYHERSPNFARGEKYVNLEQLTDPAHSYRMCDIVAADFTAFAIDYAHINDFSVDADIWSHQDPGLFFTQPESDLLHTVTRLYYRDERIFTVDWTSSQYGNAEFPALRVI